MRNSECDLKLAALLDNADNVIDRVKEQKSAYTGNRLSCPICHGCCNKSTRYNLTSCPHCNHVFQTDLTVSVAYDAKYVRQYDRRPVKAMSEVRWNFIQGHLNLPIGSCVLDIGYGNGAFLKHARAAGMKIYGIDIHSENFGIPHVGFDTPLVFDLICFFDSLEHFSDFSPIFKLKSRHIIVSIPNTPSFVLSRPQAWRHFKPGEHLHYFSRKSLDTFMRCWGFPHKVAEGYPEDELRGKLLFDQQMTDNIYTAVYGGGSVSSY